MRDNSSDHHQFDLDKGFKNQSASAQADWNNEHTHPNLSDPKINIHSIQDLIQSDIYPLKAIHRTFNDFTRTPPANILAFFLMIVNPKLALGRLS